MTLPHEYGSSHRAALTEKLRLSVDALDREVRQFWAQAFLFGGFAGLAAIGFMAAALVHGPLAQVLAAAAGGFTTICWATAVMGSRYWQSTWEDRVRLLEDYTVGPLFKVDEGPGRRHPFHSGMLFSTPALVMVLALVLAAVFGVLLVAALLELRGGWRIVGGLAIAGFFAVASLAALRISRTVPRYAPRGPINKDLYLDIP